MCGCGCTCRYMRKHIHTYIQSPYGPRSPASAGLTVNERVAGVHPSEFSFMMQMDGWNGCRVPFAASDLSYQSNFRVFVRFGLVRLFCTVKATYTYIVSWLVGGKDAGGCTLCVPALILVIFIVNEMANKYKL